MELVLQKLNYLMSSSKVYFEKADPAILELRPAPGKWSKKEILGHLIDSAINNIRRFTEIQNSDIPYHVNSYNPVQLVLANHYQEKEAPELFQLWFHLNNHIRLLIQNQSVDSLALPLILPNGATKDLKYLINDYADHLEHHLDQIYH